MVKNKRSMLSFGFNTRQLHAGQVPDHFTGSRAVPIFQTTSYIFDDTDQAARLYALEEPGYIYTRLSNPTTSVFEERMASLEGGSAAMATSSGQSAATAAILAVCSAGDHIVSTRTLYGGTTTLFLTVLNKLGIDVSLVDGRNMDEIKNSIRPNTKLIYGETLGNPGVDVFPFEDIASIARDANLPLMIDNTFATPYLCRPFEWGAHIVTHSSTKFIGGHGTTIGGVVIDGGKFDWEGSERFQDFSRPDKDYHNLVYADLGPVAYISKMRAQVMNNIGMCQAPFNSWILLQGLETLSLRMERHVQNAQLVAHFLETHPKVSWVSYPGLLNHPDHEAAKKYLPKGSGGIMGFGVKGGREAGASFINNLQLVSHLANVGDAKSLAIHPASTTHSQLSADAQIKSGVTPDFVRLSLGLEDIEDIIWDLDQALQA